MYYLTNECVVLRGYGFNLYFLKAAGKILIFISLFPLAE